MIALSAQNFLHCMDFFFLPYKSSQVACRVYGNGPRLVLAFHGYGESSERFRLLAEKGGGYTFLATDLPFHGQTSWQEGLHFTTEDLQQIMLRAVEQLNNVFTPPFSLLGYSLGGRMALRLYQSQPGLFDRLVLLAPDGLKVNGWYRLATRTWAGNRFFAFTMRHPGWFFTLLRGLNKLKLVNNSIYKFVHHAIGNVQARQELYQRWTALRKIKPDLSIIKKEIQARAMPVRLVYGKYDRIILPVRGEKFRKGIEPYCHLIILSAGHQLLREHHAALILEQLGD